MTFEKIKEIIAEGLNIEVDEIELESSLEELEIDSLYLVEIIMAIEEEFGIQFEDAEDIKTIADLVDFTEKQIAAK